ncbi:hypothetical protein B4168_2227 [Anoxybacillus flavithermus]|nr:hypothetical protein B4168_2227 [Anoxybacillus flavithermus]OAO85882.1 hypothetical protein GT23_2785 [Parageobacillus thermoglucosidasius]
MQSGKGRKIAACLTNDWQQGSFQNTLAARQHVECNRRKRENESLRFPFSFLRMKPFAYAKRSSFHEKNK